MIINEKTLEIIDFDEKEFLQGVRKEFYEEKERLVEGKKICYHYNGYLCKNCEIIQFEYPINVELNNDLINITYEKIESKYCKLTIQGCMPEWDTFLLAAMELYTGGN